MSIFDSIPDSPTQTTQVGMAPPDNSSVTSLMQQATTMANRGGPGANVAAADKWLQDKLQEAGAQPTKSIFDNMPDRPDNVSTSGNTLSSLFGSDGVNLSYQEAKPQNSKNTIDRVLSLFDEKQHPEVTGDPFAKIAEGISSAVASTAAKVGAYFNNFSTIHKTTNKSLSEDQIAAARQVGIPLPYGTASFTTMPVLDIGTEKYNELFDKAVKDAGEDPEAIRRTIEEGEKGNLSSANLANAIANKSLLVQGTKAFLNPSLANTKLYEETQHAAQAISTLKNPQASAEDKKKATYDLIVMKAQNGGFTDSLKAMYEEYKKDPLAAANGMLFSLGETPELSLVGGGGNLGKLVYGAKAEQAASLATRAAATAAEQISKARLAEIAGDTSAGLAKAKQASDLAGKALTLKRLQKLGDYAGSAATGATINTASDAANQLNEKGYISPGQVTSSAAMGAALGAGTHMLAAKALYRRRSESPVVRQRLRRLDRVLQVTLINRINRGSQSRRMRL